MQHLLQVLRARWGQHAHARHFGEQRHVIHTVVAWAVVAGDTGAVKTKDHGQAMQCHVVDELIPRTIQEGGIQRHYWSHAIHRQTGSKSYGVLLGDTDVKEPIGKM